MSLIAAHTVCMLVSYLSFLAACIVAVLFLVQERQLKRKHMGLLFHRLPSLQALDRANVVAIGVGFGLLSAGLALGLAGVNALWGRWWTGDPKEWVTVGLWGLYLAVWLVRLRATLRGRRVALLSILGFTLVLFTFLGVSWLLPSWHAYL